ncbi:hypothetical protein [Seohaeicola zhoushanensis]|nr:hypothetical protein [Seohaeicola zhoushanensis]
MLQLIARAVAPRPRQDDSALIAEQRHTDELRAELARRREQLLADTLKKGSDE